MKKILVYDWGACIEHAIRMARDGHEVFYYCPWQSAAPSSNRIMVGEGMDGIKRVKSFWEYVDTVDVIAFFSTNQSDLIEYLRKKGYKVFGAGKGEIFEQDRWFLKKAIKKLGLPYNHSEKITGLDNLKEYLEDKEDKFIKTSFIRGDMETYHYVDFESAEPWFDELATSLGAKKNTIDFIVEDPIDGLEIGYDGFTIDGQYPKKALYGYEYKDKGYIGKIVDYDTEHPSIKLVNEKLSPIFKKWKTRSMYHNELRITDEGVGYLIDPCMRGGLPPSEIELEIFSNFSEIVINGAEGILVEPKPIAKYGAEMYFESEWCLEHWLKIGIPKEIRKWVKISGCCNIDGNYYIIPKIFPNDMVACSIVAIGDSLQECFDLIKKRIEMVDAYKLNKDFDISHLGEYRDKGKKFGIKL